MKRSTPWIALILGIAIGAGALFFWQRNPATSIRRMVDPPLLVREIQQLSELITVKYTVQKVVGLEEQKVPFGSERLLLIVQAEVLGGIELSELTVENVHLLGSERVMVLLPPPKILHVAVDEENTRVWNREITWWTPWVPYDQDLERKARLAALDSVREQAIEMGILAEAAHNAQVAIRNLLTLMGIESVTFEPSS